MSAISIANARWDGGQTVRYVNVTWTTDSWRNRIGLAHREKEVNSQGALTHIYVCEYIALDHAVRFVGFPLNAILGDKHKPKCKTHYRNHTIGAPI